jgi:PAS domain S-box-containing protein
MFEPLATALALLAGFTLYATIHSLFNAWYRQQHGIYIYFALMSLFACAYIFTRLYNYHNQSADDFIFAQRLGFLFAQLLFLSQIGFISEYAKWRAPWLIALLVIPTVAMLILNLLQPYNIAHSSLPALREFTLPWGETFTDTRIFEKPPGWYLQWLVIVAIFAYQFAASFRLRLAGDIQHGNALLWYGGIFFAAILSNFLISHFLVDLPPLAEFGYIAMVLLISLDLNREVRNSRLRAESAENMWSTLVKNAPSFVLLVDAKGIIRFINHVLPGDDIDTIIGTPVKQYLHPESQAIFYQSIASVISNKQALNIQIKLGAPRNIWLEVQLAPLLVANQPEHIIITAMDITEKVAIKNRLQRSEARHRQLLLTLPYGVQEIDTEGNIIFSNPAHDELFGYEPGQMLGMSIFDLPTDKDEADKLRADIKHIYANHPVPQTYIKQDKRKTGEIFDIKIDWDYLYNEEGEVTGLISVLTDITQQIKAEQALRDSEENFRQLAENIKQLFYIRDLDSNRMLYVSPAYETIWGRSLKQIYNDPRDFLSSIHPDDKARVLELITQQNAYGELFDAEYRILDPHGIVHWVHARSYPIRDEHGKVHRIAGIVEDISERKKTEQHLQERTNELKEAHDFTEAVVNIVGAVIVVLDRAGRIVRFNHACEQVTGYTTQEVLGLYIWDFLLLPEERPGVKVTFKQLTAGQFPNHYENYWLHKDGSKRLLAWSNTCLTDAQGDVEFVVATGVDITEQREAAAALRNSAEKYRTLIEHASDIILIADLEGKLIDGNSSALEALGYSRSELLKLRVADIHPPEQLARNLKQFQTLVDTGSVTTHDTTLLRKDGTVIPVDINANIVDYQRRTVAVGFIRDIRARKLLEAQQRQTEQRYRDMLVREVHHRIKNNLQGVIGLLRNSFSDRQHSDVDPERLITRAITQIATIALVHGLQAHYKGGQVRICDITHAIVDQSHNFAPNDIHIEFHDNVTHPGLLQEQEAIPLALVINEIMTNAIKHIPAPIANKQVIVELKGSPEEGMDLLVFNSGAHLPQGLDTSKRNLSGVGLDLIHALLPKQFTSFSLINDPLNGGVYAKLQIDAAILSRVPDTEQTPSAYNPNQTET